MKKIEPKSLSKFRQRMSRYQTFLFKMIQKLGYLPVAEIEEERKRQFMDIENLASRLHQVYQEELNRQGKQSKYSDFYTELPEDIKDLDRALARYINEFILPKALDTIQSETRREMVEKILELVCPYPLMDAEYSAGKSPLSERNRTLEEGYHLAVDELIRVLDQLQKEEE